MSLGERVFLYCERGTNGELFAEPLNAVSNLAFLLAALIALMMLMRRPKEERSADHALLVALVFLIGLGSLAFHLFADKATLLADVIPIDLFMLVYLGFALNRFLRVPPGWTVLLLILFTAAMFGVGQLKCWSGGIGLYGPEVAGAGECMNGSLPYVPALIVMGIIGALLYERKHKAAPYVLFAALIFTISIAFRSADMALCNEIVLDGKRLGTHFVWHILNAIVLFLLLVASFEVGPRDKAPAAPRDEARAA